MNSAWFTTEQLEKDTFVISEYKHWEETHCYLLLGEQSAALIDTGLGVADIRKEVRAITDLPIQVVTTHIHADHIGGHGLFENRAIPAEERAWFEEKFPLPTAFVLQNNLLKQPCDFPPEFDPKNYHIYQGKAERLLRDGDRVDLGGRILTALHTPGHSPGHLCFYEQARKTLYSGDLLYLGALDCYYPTTDPEAFAASTEKAASLPLEKIYPGHHQLKVSPDLAQRVAAAFKQLKEQGRLKQGNGIIPFGDFSIHL